MNAVIYHFSGTGNSLKIARDVAEGIGGAELIPLARAGEKELSPAAGVVGIVFPVYAWGPPTVVMRFLDRIRLPADNYVFAVCTCGGSAGGTLGILEKKLAERGAALSSGFVIKMPTNYIVWSSALPRDRQEKMFERAAVRVQEISKAVALKKVLPVEKGSAVSRLFLNGVYRYSVGHFARSDRNFTVDPGCSSCGLCEKVCQVGNVKLSDGRPVWSGHCEACLACLQWCPEEAIQYGGKTKDRTRYHHPLVKVSELF